MFYKVFAAPMLRAEGQEMMCLPKGPIGIAISGTLSLCTKSLKKFQKLLT